MAGGRLTTWKLGSGPAIALFKVYQNIKADAELTAEDIEEHIKKLKLNKKRKRLNKTVNKGNEKKIIHKKEYQEPFEDGIFEDDFLTDDE